jgi:hypothetical protein
MCVRGRSDAILISCRLRIFNFSRPTLILVRSASVGKPKLSGGKFQPLANFQFLACIRRGKEISRERPHGPGDQLQSARMAIKLAQRYLLCDWTCMWDKKIN